MRADDITLPDLDSGAREMKESKQGFKLVQLGELCLKPPSWIIRGILEKDTLVNVFGDPSVGKTFFLISILSSVATNFPWQGIPVKESGPVVLLLGEGHGGIRRRFEAWSLHSGIPISEAPIYIGQGPISISDPNSMDILQEAIQTTSEHYGVPKVIAVDTWGRLLGADENSAEYVGAGIKALDRIRQQTGACILIIHHSGNENKGRPRGSSALRAAVDSEIAFSRGKGDLIQMKWTKAKDTPLSDSFAFRIEQVDLGITDDEGGSVSSAVLCLEANALQIEGSELGSDQVKAMRAIKDIEERMRHQSQLSIPSGQRIQISKAESSSAWRNAGIDRRRIPGLFTSLSRKGLIECAGDSVYIL